MATKKREKTIDELLRERQLEQIENFSIDDGEEEHSIDQIIEAASQQGIFDLYNPFEERAKKIAEEEEQAPKRPTETQSARQTVDQLGNLGNMVKKTEFETLPKITNEAVRNYNLSKVGRDYLSKYDDSTSYADIQKDIAEVQSKKGEDEYDLALAMLKNYVNQKYDLNGTDLSQDAIKRRQEVYDYNQNEIDRLNQRVGANEGDTENLNLDDEETVSKYLNHDKNAVDFFMGYRSGRIAQDAANQEKYITMRDYIENAANSDSVRDLRNEVENLRAQNATYDRTQGQSDRYALQYGDDVKNEKSDLLAGTLHTRNNVPENFDDRVENGNDRFTDMGDISHPAIKRYGGENAVEDYNNMDAHTEMLTSEEKGIYSYLLRNEGEVSANAYLDSLKDVLQKRASETTQEYIDNASGAEKAVLLAASVPMNVYGTVTGFAEDAANIVAGKDIHPYSEAHSMYNIAQQTRSSVAEDIDEATNSWNVLGFSAGDAFQAAMSIPDFMLGSLTPSYYAASMSMGAAQSTAKELWEEGATNEQIVAESVLSGAAEYVFEKVSLDKIIDTADKSKLVKSALAGMAIEGSEEANTEIANIISDVLVRGSQSEWHKAIQNYKDQGYSDSESQAKAFSDMAKRVGYSAIGGAIGGAGGGAGVAIEKGAGLIQNKSERNKYIASTGVNIYNTGNIQNLIDKANESDNDEVKAQLAKVKTAQENNNENKLIKEAGKLYSVLQSKNMDALDNSASEVVKLALREAYAKKTGEDVTSDNVVNAADAIYKAEYTSESLTPSERRIVSESASQKAYEAVKNDSSVTEKAVTAKQRAMNDLVSTAALTQEKEKPKSDNEVLKNINFDIHEDDGKAYTKDGQKQVDLASVAAVGKNDISFSLKNGETESLNNLDLPKQQAVLAQSIIDVQNDTGISLTPEVANTIFQEYDKVKGNYKSVGAYMLDTRKVLFNGYTNNTAPDNTIKLPQSLRNRLYSMGRRLSETSTASQQNAVRARISEIKTRKGAVSFRDGMSLDGNGKVSYEENGKTYKLDPMRQASVDFLSMTGESLGLDIVFYRSTKDGKGRFSSKYVTDNKFGKAGQQAPSGFWRGGKMYIDVNAGMNGEGLILFTASHELVHMIREGSPEDFKALADFLVQSYSENGTDINDLIRTEMAKSTNLTRDEAYEEVIADACESFLRDTLINGKSQTLYRENPTLWTKIKNALKTIIDRLKSLKPQSEASRKTLKLGVEKLETAYDLFTRGIERSAQNLRSMEGEKSQNSRYTFAGREANNADVGTLEEAQQMEEEGVDSEDIRQQTGWFKGLDGLWRFELDDSQMMIKDTEPRYGKLYLHEVIDYPQLFEAYPRLESFVVSFKDMPDGERGSWDASRRTIEINNKLRQDEDAFTETLIHELQHAVQRIEGFAKGASPSYWANAYDEDNRTIAEKKEASSRRRQYDSEYNEALKNDPEFVERIERIDSAVNSFIYDETTQEEWDKAQEDIKNLKDEYGEKKVNHFLHVVRSRRTAESKVGRMSRPFDLYQATAGEVEARDSASRRGYTAEQRKNIRPDIDREDVVFRPGDDANVKYKSREDTDYISAVNRGDMETAQRLVDEAAKEAGYNTPVLYHGTQKFGFTQFDLNKMDDGMSIFLTSTEETASTYSGVRGKRNISEKNLSDRAIDNMSPKELVDAVNRHIQNGIDEIEYRYYSNNDIDKMVSSVSDSLKELKNHAERVLSEQSNDYDEVLFDIMVGYIDAVQEKDKFTDRHEYRRIAGLISELIDRDEKNNAHEFATPEYERLRDTLAILGEIRDSRLENGNTDYAIIHAIEDTFYVAEKAEYLRESLKRESNYGNYATYAKLDNPLVIDANGSNWNRIQVPRSIQEDFWDFFGFRFMSTITRKYAEYAKAKGYDGVIFKNLEDNGGRGPSVANAKSDVYVVFDSAQVKSADPVTYDNDGNVIPLSERFNDSEQDIRYKSRLSAYDAFSELSEEGKNETIDILSRLANGQAIPLNTIDSLELFVNADKQRGELNETININTPQRERLRKEVQKKIENLGSAVEKNNKILYNGDVKRERRADIVIGLPSAGKSSVLVDPLSAVYGSRIVDSDIVKELLPEYNNGLGAGNVHEESKKINERILKHSCENGENIVMPIVGSDANGVIRRINFLKSKGYDVYLHLNELPMYKALGRMITRYIEKGRYLSPAIIYKYQNKPTEVFEQIIKQKGDLLSGYSRYSNDVEYGERPIFKEGTEDYYGAYTRRFEENGSERGRDLRESREGLSGLTTKYQSREDARYKNDRVDENQFQDFDISDWEYDDTTADTIAREYVSHHEDIGEVLKNISDIDITPAKVTSIVTRVLRENIGTLDKTTRELLSTEVQIALDRVNRDDPATVINNMTQAVRDAIENAYVPNEKAEDDYKELLSVFKGKRFYLSEEQLNYLKEHDSSLGEIRRELMNRVNIVDKNNLKRSINGGYQNAQELSLEGLYDVLESPDEYLSYKRDQWNEYGYKAPFIIRDALNKLRDMRSQRITEVYSENAIDDMAVTLSAKITGGIVESKYNSKKNPYITKLVNDLKAKRSEAVRKQKEKNRQKLAELKKKERERADKREKELAKHYQEQRAKSVEKRNLTKQKNIVARKFRSLDQKLNRADKDKTVKEGLRPTAAKLLEVGNMLFPETRSLEQMAREGVADATPAEQKLLDRYVEYLDIREKTSTEEGRKHASAVLANIRKLLSNDGVMVEVTENGKTVKKKMSVTARERMRYDNAMREYNGLKLKTALVELEDAYRAVKDSSVGYIADSYDPNIVESIQDLRAEVGNTLAKDTTAEQLKTLNDIITNTLTSINNANKLFTMELSMTATANAVMRDIKNVRQLKDSRNKLLYKSGEFLGWANFKPIYAMRFIGSDTFTDLFWKLQKGESDWYVDIAEAKEFKDKLDEKYGVGKLNIKEKTDFNYNKKATFTALDGSEFTLNLDQMMDIYAASRREQALLHLLYGGFTFAKDVKSDKFGKIQTGAKVYQLTMETIDKIADTLTVNEKKYVEEMQEYLSTVMADKGNEVSMKLHGIKLFNEEIYWSISSTDIYAPQSDVEQEQKKDLVKKIRNAGFTKKTVKNASNPIVLQGFETKWSSHVNDMSLYHSMTLPLEDFTRVANYKERGKGSTATTGVKGVLNQAYGNAASNYINQLIDDINGGIQQKMRVGLADNLVSLAKKGAVLNNLSVIIQQPSSVFRAMAYVDTRYFMLATGNKFWSFEDKQFTWNKHNKMYEELIKYAPIAGIKRMGSFDTGAGRGVIDYLASGGNESIASRVYNKSEDIASFLPEFADELAWLKLWQAIQHETKAKYGYKIGTEENKVKSGERFNEVVHLTQVYDSTLSRSQAMRGKDFGSKMLTSFMAEPTTYMNMAVDAVVQSKRTHNYKRFAKTMSALSLALIANALLVAIPRGMRDDDDDETFDEKYMQAFWDDIVSGVNPLNYFPVLKDVSSIVFENRDPSRMDLSVVSDTANTLKKAYKNIDNGKFTANDVIDIIGSAAAWGGITMKNLVRDIRSVVNTVNTFKTPRYNKEVDEMGLSLPYAYQKAYDKAYDEGYSEEDCKSKAESAARKEITKALKDKYLKALKESDSDAIKEIMRYMSQSGLYHKKGNTVDDTLKEWRKGSDEAEERAKVAEERKAK